MVSVQEIEKNDYNLNLPRYIDSTQAEDRQDIAGHLQGGIPAADVDALQRYWAVCPALKAALFAPARSGYYQLAVDKAGIKPAIYQHPEFARFIAGMASHFASWQQHTTATLKALRPGFHPKQLIVQVAESLLAHYQGQPLIDAYDVYQHLMDYWAETLQDDAYLVAQDGWKAQTYRVIEKDKKGKEKDKGWACDLLPKALIVARYFAAEQTAMEQTSAALDAASAQLAELEEEQGGEDGVFNGYDKVNAAAVKDRLKEIGKAKVAADELAVLHQWQTLAVQEAVLKKTLKEQDAQLDALAYARYPQLTEPEIQQLAVDDKWLATLQRAISAEMDRVSQTLTQRVKELAERYETPLPQLASRVSALQAKVDAHLLKMGFVWK
jgi:type I restriction enzyme M protein